MSRRNAAVKRPVLPDPQFNSRLASMMISRLMKHGKKSTAQKILSDAFSLISERTGGNAVELFETAVKNHSKEFTGYGHFTTVKTAEFNFTLISFLALHKT